ncbi:hypothetical protein [Caballeronia sp. NK8]|uniref:hypothetical protein n=1 Tax=Caballeronia sp. NK8 TaxID=140098 RepID=UPI001BCC13FA|nr:hypothetical protein [Caballeronia sp. NK8]
MRKITERYKALWPYLGMATVATSERRWRVGVTVIVPRNRFVLMRNCHGCAQEEKISLFIGFIAYFFISTALTEYSAQQAPKNLPGRSILVQKRDFSRVLSMAVSHKAREDSARTRHPFTCCAVGSRQVQVR